MLSALRVSTLRVSTEKRKSDKGCFLLQYEVSMNAYERLSNTTDAQGRKLEIFKLPRPPPMFRTYKEASGFKVRKSIHSDVKLYPLLDSVLL